MSSEQKEKLAAGGIVIDSSNTEVPLVLLVHRPKYDDWSFPKGGLKPGETLEEAAVREVKEETGLECRIIRELSATRYLYRTRKGNRRPKVVQYFLMEPSGGQITTGGDEVDRAEWLGLREAQDKLTYLFDKQLLGKTIDS